MAFVLEFSFGFPTLCAHRFTVFLDDRKSMENTSRNSEKLMAMRARSEVHGSYSGVFLIL